MGIVVNDMKKLFVVFLLLLVLLSSCGYSAKDIDEMQEKWNEEYSTLEEKYYEAAGHADVYCYYDDADPDITEKEAHDALLKICYLLSDAGY